MANTVRGHIEQLPSGSFRVHVYAGTDPVTGRAAPPQRDLPGRADRRRGARAIAERGRRRPVPQPGRDARPGPRQVPRSHRPGAIDQRGAPGLHPPHHRAGAGRREGPQARRRLARRAVHGAEEVLTALRQAPEGRAPHRRSARLRPAVRAAPGPPHRPAPHLRQPVPPARLQADETGDDPADPLDHLRRAGPGRPVRVDRPQRRQERPAAAPAQARARPAQSRSRPRGCSTSSGPKTRSSASTCGPRSPPEPGAAK